MLTPTHFAFSDESCHNTGRFRGIGLVTATKGTAIEANRRMAELLRESSVAEFKWQKLRTRKNLFAAKKIIDLTLNLAEPNSFRIDVLLWDIEDSRHKILGRDDHANLQRMCYHLVKTVLTKRWPGECLWSIHPDETNIVNWDEVQHFLGLKGSHLEIRKDLTTADRIAIRLVREYSIVEIVQAESHELPLVQIADLFVGLGIFSHSEYSVYEQWCVEKESAGDMFGYDGVFDERPTNAGLTRSEVLEHLDRGCKARKLRVSLKSERRLVTKDLRFPIGYWLWKPQQEMDKAPRRSERADSKS